MRAEPGAVSLERWVAFVGVLLVVLCTPGPDFVVVLRHALVDARHGVKAATGIVTGLAVHTTVAAFGLAAVVAARPDVLVVIRWVGAVYLLWLGVHAIRAALRRPPHAPVAPASARPFVAGLLGNLLNPKALLFFLGLIPQFLDPARGPVGQILLLAGTTVTASVLWWTVVIAVAGHGRALLDRRRARRVVDAATGAALVGVAVAVLRS